MNALSIIILTYNSEKDIYDCLDSIHQYNDIGDTLEIIIVDNQSTNYADMQSKISQLYPHIPITQPNNFSLMASPAPP